jgi:hypothetical protein
LRKRDLPLPPPERLPLVHQVGQRSAAVAEDFFAEQPDDVVDLRDHAGGDQLTTQLAQHPAQLRPGQADVGEGVFAHRRNSLRPAQQPGEQRATQRVQPGEYGCGLTFAPVRGAALPLVRVGLAFVEMETQGVDQRRGTVGRYRIHRRIWARKPGPSGPGGGVCLVGLFWPWMYSLTISGGAAPRDAVKEDGAHMCPAVLAWLIWPRYS